MRVQDVPYGTSCIRIQRDMVKGVAARCGRGRPRSWNVAEDSSMRKLLLRIALERQLQARGEKVFPLADAATLAAFDIGVVVIQLETDIAVEIPIHAHSPR